jgi:DNA-binding IclR family transcriptional regulator
VTRICLTPEQIAALLGEPVATVRDRLMTLERRGEAERDADGRWTLTPDPTGNGLGLLTPPPDPPHKAADDTEVEP